MFSRNSGDNLSIVLPAGEAVDRYRNQAYILPIAEPNYIPVLDSNFSRPAISAKSAVVYDTRSGRLLFEKDIKLQLPVASLTKVMSAVVILEHLKLDDIVTVADESIGVDGEKQDLYAGERISVRNLLKLMLIESSNDAAFALAVHAEKEGFDFVEKMNMKAKELAMNHSLFLDPAGLSDNAYSSVEDLIKLVEYSLKYGEIWDISSEKTAIVESSDEKIVHNIKSTNRLLGMINDIIGGKTGYTDGAGQCMILVTAIPGYSGKVISVVIGSEDRFGDTQKLIDWIRVAYSWE